MPAEVAVTLDGTEVPTLNEGNSLTVTVADGSVLLNDHVGPLNGATVVQTDLFAANGVIHVIDAVLVNEAILNG